MCPLDILCYVLQDFIIILRLPSSFVFIKRLFYPNLKAESKVSVLIQHVWYLPHKGYYYNLTECMNWMRTTLLRKVNKIISHKRNKRLLDYISPRCLNPTGSRSNNQLTPLYLCFIYFAKAFDVIDQREILKIPEYRGVPRTLINLIHALYSGAICRVRNEQQLSRQI